MHNTGAPNTGAFDTPGGPRMNHDEKTKLLGRFRQTTSDRDVFDGRGVALNLFKRTTTETAQSERHFVPKEARDAKRFPSLHKLANENVADARPSHI